MIKYSELLILNLISKKSKKTIGEIVNIAFTADFRRAIGLIVKNDKLYRNKILIPMESIDDIDKDSIIVENEESLKNEKPYEGKELNLRDWEIITENHECVGYVKDMIIRLKDGRVLGFIISEGLIEDIVSGRNFLPLLKTIEITDKSILINKESIGDINKNNHYYKKIIELED